MADWRETVTCYGHATLLEAAAAMEQAVKKTADVALSLYKRHCEQEGLRWTSIRMSIEKVTIEQTPAHPTMYGAGLWQISVQRTITHVNSEGANP